MAASQARMKPAEFLTLRVLARRRRPSKAAWRAPARPGQAATAASADTAGENSTLRHKAHARDVFVSGPRRAKLSSSSAPQHATRYIARGAAWKGAKIAFQLRLRSLNGFTYAATNFTRHLTNPIVNWAPIFASKL